MSLIMDNQQDFVALRLGVFPVSNIKYICIGGVLRSPSHSAPFTIAGRHLSGLYKVDRRECLVIRDSNSLSKEIVGTPYQVAFQSLTGSLDRIEDLPTGSVINGAIVLRPSADGNYTLPEVDLALLDDPEPFDYTEEVFLRAIWAEPENHLPKLVYCDWLGEIGDHANELKGELIRLLFTEFPGEKLVPVVFGPGRKPKNPAYFRKLTNLDLPPDGKDEAVTLQGRRYVREWELKKMVLAELKAKGNTQVVMRYGRLPAGPHDIVNFLFPNPDLPRVYVNNQLRPVGQTQWGVVPAGIHPDRTVRSEIPYPAGDARENEQGEGE